MPDTCLLLRLPLALQDGRRDGLLGRLAAPENELESGVIMLTGFEREVEKGLALCRAGTRIRENHRVAKDDGAVLRPEVEMPDPETRIHMHQKRGDVFPPGRALDAHIEGTRKVKRLQIFAPGETEMMVAPAAGDGEVEFVATR